MLNGSSEIEYVLGINSAYHESTGLSMQKLLEVNAWLY